MALPRGRGRGIIPGLIGILGLLDGSRIFATNLRVTQEVVEPVELSSESRIRLTQFPIEPVELSGQSRIRVTQLVIEVIYPFSCGNPNVPPEVGVPGCPEPLPTPAGDDDAGCPDPVVTSAGVADDGCPTPV